MKKFSFYSCVIFALVFSSISFADEKPPSIKVTFENWDEGQKYNLTMAQKDFGKVDSFPSDWSNRMQIDRQDSDRNDSDRKYSNKHLRVIFPTKTFGPENSGNHFKVFLEPSDEYESEYRLKFDKNFDFDKTGKLPGLCGGDCNTDGKKSDDGFSVRFIWKQDGELAINIYYADQPGNDGQEITTNYKMPKNEWVTLKQSVKLNKGNQKNGVLQVWVNDQLKIDRKDIRYVPNSSKKIDAFYFSAYFHNLRDWAPEVSSYARFDDFVIEKK